MTPGKFTSLILCLGLAVLATTTSSANDEAAGFAGFDAPGTTPQIFAPGLISSDAYEFAVTFTPDMTEMYLTRRSDPGPNQIFMARVTAEGLQGPTPVSFCGSDGPYEPSIAPGGKTFYFGQGIQIMACQRNDDGWSAPQALPEAVNGGFAMSMCADAAENLYFTGNDGLVVARRNVDGYHAAETLGPNFGRAAGGSAHGYISPDGSFLVFDSQGRSDGLGRADLYVSFRTADGGWTEPRNLEALNTKGTDMCPSISPDGQFLFFSRDGNIWWVDASVLKLCR